MQLAQAPATGTKSGTQTDREVKDKLVIDPEDKVAKKLEPQIREVMERATNLLFHPDMLRRADGAKADPVDLLPVFNREGLRVEVVSDLKATWRKYHDGKDPTEAEYAEMEAFTYTTKGKDGKATGTVIVMDASTFETSRHAATGRTLLPMPKVLAALCHELHHCRQSMYPENGVVPVPMTVGAREFDAYRREQEQLDNIYLHVSRTGVRDYAGRYGTPGAGGTRKFDGEMKVDEQMNFELFSRVLKPQVELFKARAQRDPTVAAAEAVSPTGAITIGARGEGANPVVIDPKHKESFETVQAAIKNGTKITAVAEGDRLFRITAADGMARDIVLARNHRSPEQQARALALGIKAMDSMREINTILRDDGITDAQLTLIEHQTGSPDRKIGIVGKTKSGQSVQYGTYTVRPSDQVQQIGQGRFESWETEILAALKASRK